MDIALGRPQRRILAWTGKGAGARDSVGARVDYAEANWSRSLDPGGGLRGACGSQGDENAEQQAQQWPLAVHLTVGERSVFPQSF